MLLEEYQATGRTRFPHKGMEVKVFEKPVYDPGKALEWCKGYLAAAVKQTLDTRMFESFAKANPIQGLVEIVKTPKAMLPTNIELDERPLDVQAALDAPTDLEDAHPHDRYEPNEGGA